MTWNHYRLTFRLLSPMHVGYRRAGNLMQTRPYVPGRLLWAALTARLTRGTGKGNDAAAYRRVGDQLQASFRFGYLWPGLGEKDTDKKSCVPPERPYFPWEHEEDFDYLLLGSVMSTAIVPHQTTAHEGSLHEVEFLAPHARDGRPVFLLGDLWVREGALPTGLQGWKDALRHIQLGGERGYGWGQVALENCSEDHDGTLTLNTDEESKIRWHKENNDEVVLTIPAGRSLPAHALAAGEGAFPAEAVQGPVEVLVGWGWYGGRYGLSAAQVAYSPGGRVTQDTEVIVGPSGIWQAKP